MLKYLWMVVQDLFLTVTYTTWMHAVLSRLFGRKGRMIHAIALGAGSLASVVLAIVKYNTKLIISSHWNHYLYAVMISLSLAFLVLCLLFGRRESGKMGVGGAALSAVYSSAPRLLLIFFCHYDVLIQAAGFMFDMIILSRISATPVPMNMAAFCCPGPSSWAWAITMRTNPTSTKMTPITFVIR